MTEQEKAQTPQARHSAYALAILLLFTAVVDYTLSPTGAFASVLIASITIVALIFILHLVTVGLDRVFGYD